MSKATSITFEAGSINHWAPVWKSPRGHLFLYPQSHPDGEGGHTYETDVFTVILSTGKGSQHGLDHQIEMVMSREKVQEIIDYLTLVLKEDR
jgi:hypothetical protein